MTRLERQLEDALVDIRDYREKYRVWSRMGEHGLASVYLGALERRWAYARERRRLLAYERDLEVV